MQKTTGKIPSATCEIYGQNIESISEKNFDVRNSHPEMLFKNWCLTKCCAVTKLINYGQKSKSLKKIKGFLTPGGEHFVKQTDAGGCFREM